MMVLGNHEEGYRYGQLALKLFDTINCREMMARTYTPVYGFINAYKDPLRDSIAPLLEAYRLNILTGDVEMAITSKSISVGNSLLAGVPLFRCISGLGEVIDDCKVHNQNWCLIIVRMSLQFATNLSGRNGPNTPFELTGEIMNEKKVEKEVLEAQNDVQLAWLYFLKCNHVVDLSCNDTSVELTVARCYRQYQHRTTKHKASRQITQRLFTMMKISV